ncbi:MAG: ABC transporter ATP-binding protein [Oscillospiraceae bacterium]|nr:ABC transporter ATP-binding protein [Oscillospiraceae bacterium]
MKNSKHESFIDVIKSEIRKNRLMTACLVTAVAGAVAAALLPPLVLEKMVNELVSHKSISLRLAVMYFGVLIISGIFDSLKEMLLTMSGQRITHGLRSRMCGKLSVLPASYFTSNEPGTVTSGFINDVDTVGALFTNGIISMCTDICKVLSIIAVIFVKSTGLGIALVFTAPLLLQLTRTFQKRMLAAQKMNRKAVGKVSQFIPETINNIRTVHCLMRESYMEKRYNEKISQSYKATEKSNLYDSVYSPIIIMISTVLIALLMIMSAMGGQMQTFFGMSVGTAVAVIAYVSKVFEPIESIGMEIQNIQSAAAGISRINELLREDESCRTDDSITIETLLASKQSGIRFDNVVFSYDDRVNVIDSLSLSIDTGEMVTLAGRTGAGKSTVFKLLTGLYIPQAGKVTIFGFDASIIPNSIKRRLFGYVEQSFHMVPGTIADQITLFDKSVSMEDVKRAAGLAGIHESISELPDGYNTDCRSAGFSQGQLQLLSIARAAAADPPVMLLDEITANLDSITEQKVLRAIENASAGRTVISISHRLYENMGSRLINI